MPRAIWKGALIAESNDTVVVEGNHYFPPDSLDRQYLEASDRSTVCPWKGTANYYDVVVGSDRNPAAAWYYTTPKAAAAEIEGRVAFWKGVAIEA